MHKLGNVCSMYSRYFEIYSDCQCLVCIWRQITQSLFVTACGVVTARNISLFSMDWGYGFLMDCFKQCSVGIVPGCVLVKNMGMKQPTKITHQKHILFKNERGNVKLSDLLVLYKKCQRMCKGWRYNRVQHIMLDTVYCLSDTYFIYMASLKLSLLPSTDKTVAWFQALGNHIAWSTWSQQWGKFVKFLVESMWPRASTEKLQCQKVSERV